MIWRYSGSFRRHLERGFNQAQKILPGCCEKIKLFFSGTSKTWGAMASYIIYPRMPERKVYEVFEINIPTLFRVRNLQKIKLNPY